MLSPDQYPLDGVANIGGVVFTQWPWYLTNNVWFVAPAVNLMVYDASETCVYIPFSTTHLYGHDELAHGFICRLLDLLRPEE